MESDIWDVFGSEKYPILIITSKMDESNFASHIQNVNWFYSVIQFS